MTKNILFFIVIFVVSCQKKENKEQSCSTEKKFEMYQMSEMAALMEQMYAHNDRVKQQIINGDSIGKFPDYFNKIHSAKFTSESDNDDFFKEKAKNYIAAQQLIYTDTINRKENFNKGVDACIDCHNGKCGGPIPRIKKLYIK